MRDEPNRCNCGAKPRIREIPHGSFDVYCQTCSRETNVYHPDRNNAVYAWNRGRCFNGPGAPVGLTDDYIEAAKRFAGVP